MQLTETSNISHDHLLRLGIAIHPFTCVFIHPSTLEGMFLSFLNTHLCSRVKSFALYETLKRQYCSSRVRIIPLKKWKAQTYSYARGRNSIGPKLPMINWPKFLPTSRPVSALIPSYTRVPVILFP